MSTYVTFLNTLKLYIKDTGIKDIQDHIGDLIPGKQSKDIRDGITFRPKDYRGLIAKLERTKNNNQGNSFRSGSSLMSMRDHQCTKAAFDFSIPDRLSDNAYVEDDCRCLTGRLALSATKGRGFRSVGKPSVHFKVSPNECNIHLDKDGFKQKDLLGRAFINPDFGRHTLNELWLAPTGYKLQAVLPHSDNRYESRYGMAYVPYERIKYRSMSKFSISVDMKVDRQGLRNTGRAIWDLNMSHLPETRIMVNWTSSD